MLCTTDSMALGVLEYCMERGLDVPGDISVTGFDGVEQALACGLSTVIQPNKHKGATVGKVLSQLIEASLKDEPLTTPHLLLPTRFSRGRTVAPARG